MEFRPCELTAHSFQKIQKAKKAKLHLGLQIYINVQLKSSTGLLWNKSPSM